MYMYSLLAIPYWLWSLFVPPLANVGPGVREAPWLSTSLGPAASRGLPESRAWGDASTVNREQPVGESQANIIPHMRHI